MTTAGDRSPLRDLIRHTLIYGSGYVTMAVASVVLVPVYTRQLSPAGYGLLGLMLVLYGLMTQVYDFGVTNSVGRFYFDASGEPSAALHHVKSTAVGVSAGFGALLTLVLWVFAPTWSSLLTQSSAHAGLVRIVALTLYAEALAIVPLTLIRMQERSRAFVSITVARFVVTLALSMLFVIGLRWGVRGALLANLASGTCVLLVLAPEYRHVLHARPSLRLLRQMLVFGLPFYPVILSAWFIEASDRYLLGLYKGHTQVGWYVLGYKVAQVMQIALAAFSMGWAPLRYRIQARPNAQQVYRRLTSFYVLAAATLTVGLALFAREIVHVIAPASYAPASRIVPLIAFGYALNGLYLMMVTGMGVAKKTVPMAWIVGIAAATNVGINIVVIPRWGMMAAAVTTVIANLIMVAGSWFHSQRVYPIPYDWMRIARTAVVGIAVVVVVLYLAPAHGAAALAIDLGAWLAFVALLVWTRTLPLTELSVARDWLLRLRHGSPREPPGERVPG